MPNVYTALPTRGLIYGRTIQGLKKNDSDFRIYPELPIPKCFNKPVRDFLQSDSKYLWFVEEDNVPTKGILKRLLKTNRPISTVDYKVGAKVSHVHKIDGKVAWCGLGCTLIKREVFEALSDPWFRIDKRRNHKTGEWSDISKRGQGKGFGGHDVWFFTQARKGGYNIHVIDEKIDHLRCDQLKRTETNNGTYTINKIGD
jgi:hypothetical protein